MVGGPGTRIYGFLYIFFLRDSLSSQNPKTYWRTQGSFKLKKENKGKSGGRKYPLFIPDLGEIRCFGRY